MSRNIPYDRIVLWVFFAFVGFFLLQRLFPGFRLPFLKTTEERKTIQAVERSSANFDIGKYLKKNGQAVDFSFLDNMQEKHLPTLHEALQKRHYDAKINFYNTNNLLLEGDLTLDDFYNNDNSPNPVLVEYVYRYSVLNDGRHEYTDGRINYCATVRQDKNGSFHLVLERRQNNIPICFYHNPQETFEYQFVPSEKEMQLSSNKISTKIDNSRRNKDLSRMTQEELNRIENL